jgi:ABC-type tungstate transport system substrate-binding protein
MGVFLEAVVRASSVPQYQEMLKDVVKHTKDAHESLYKKTIAQIQQTSGEAQFRDLVDRGNAIAGACGRVVFRFGVGLVGGGSISYDSRSLCSVIDRMPALSCRM